VNKHRKLHLPAWLAKHMPTPEDIAGSRLLRPVAHRVLHPSLWHMNRRSVARGVACGMFWSMAVPFLQVFFAAFTAMYFRGNVPIAALCTFISNPFTTPAIVFAAYKFGGLLLPPVHARAAVDPPLHWFAQAAKWIGDFGAPTFLGLLVFSIAASVVGYFAVQLVWRQRTISKWRKRNGLKT
jgi:uncharacterized protein